MKKYQAPELEVLLLANPDVMSLIAESDENSLYVDVFEDDNA